VSTSVAPGSTPRCSAWRDHAGLAGPGVAFPLYPVALLMFRFNNPYDPARAAARLARTASPGTGARLHPLAGVRRGGHRVRVLTKLGRGHCSCCRWLALPTWSPGAGRGCGGWVRPAFRGVAPAAHRRRVPSLLALLAGRRLVLSSRPPRQHACCSWLLRLTTGSTGCSCGGRSFPASSTALCLSCPFLAFFVISSSSRLLLCLSLSTESVFLFRLFFWRRLLRAVCCLWLVLLLVVAVADSAGHLRYRPDQVPLPALWRFAAVSPARCSASCPPASSIRNTQWRWHPASPGARSAGGSLLVRYCRRGSIVSVSLILGPVVGSAVRRRLVAAPARGPGYCLTGRRPGTPSCSGPGSRSTCRRRRSLAGTGRKAVDSTSGWPGRRRFGCRRAGGRGRLVGPASYSAQTVLTPQHQWASRRRGPSLAVLRWVLCPLFRRRTRPWPTLTGSRWCWPLCCRFTLSPAGPVGIRP